MQVLRVSRRDGTRALFLPFLGTRRRNPRHSFIGLGLNPCAEVLRSHGLHYWQPTLNIHTHTIPPRRRSCTHPTLLYTLAHVSAKASPRALCLPLPRASAGMARQALTQEGCIDAPFLGPKSCVQIVAKTLNMSPKGYHFAYC